MGVQLDSPADLPGETPSRRRKLTAILHADVAGFSRLMGEDEAGTHRALGELRHAIDPLIAAHGGRIVGTAGDSLLADFASVVDALNCAVEMQHASRAINDPLPPQRLECLGPALHDRRDRGRQAVQELLDRGHASLFTCGPIIPC